MFPSLPQRESAFKCFSGFSSNEVTYIYIKKKKGSVFVTVKGPV